MNQNCNYILESDQRCGSTFLLHEIYFRDPENKSNRQFTYICKTHYDQIMREMTEKIKTLTFKRDNLIAERNKERIIAQQNDQRYNDQKQQKIEDLRIIIKKILTNECRNIFCMKTLQGNNERMKFFSAHTFLPNGKRHYTFYFCSNRCMQSLRGKCGIITLTIHGQRTLSNTT